MEKILNGFFMILKVILLLACFVLTFFVIMNMYQRLDKNIIESIPTMFPFVLLLLLFTLNFVLRQKSVNQSLFYNITCCFACTVILFAIYRSFYDENMVMILKLGYHINFNYFSDVIAPMKVMLYLLSGANLLLMFTSPKNGLK